MKPTVSRLELEYKGRVEFQPINIDKPESAASKEKYRFVGQPQFVVVAANGSVVVSRNGYQNYETLRADLEKALQNE